MELIQVSNIQKTYDQKPVLNTINLSINEGEFFTFLGPSGCGKTTLLRIIAGFVSPEQGQVFFNQQEITNLPPEKRDIGMVFQNYALFPFLSVFDNVAYGLRIKRLKKPLIKDRVKDALKLVNLDGYETRNISELSGGEQQRVALARSLVMQPKLLLLDEPLSNLDARLRDKMRQELKTIQSQLGITTIFVTHDQTEALSMSDRIAVFNQGHCIQVGSPYDIYHHPNSTFVADFIGDTNLITVNINDDHANINPNFTLRLSNSEKGNTISIRPQDIKFCRHGDTKDNSFSAKVIKKSLNGHYIEYGLLVDDTPLKLMQVNEYHLSHQYNIGDNAQIIIDPRSIKVLQD